MRVMILAKSSPETETAQRPPEDPQEGYEAMGRFTQELIGAGILKDEGRLLPTSGGARVRVRGKKRTVVDGPFLESKEIVAGYWIWEVQSLGEAIDWLKRAPFGDGQELEVRPILDAPEGWPQQR